MESATPAPGVWDAPWAKRITTIVVGAIWLGAILAEVGTFPYMLQVRGFHNAAGLDAGLEVRDVLATMPVLVMTSLGALIVLRGSSRRFGWLMLASGFSIAIVTFTGQYSQVALIVAPEANLPLGLPAAWVQDLWPIPFVLTFSLPLLFPTGKLPSSRWRTIFWLYTVCWGLFIVVLAFARRPLTNAFLEYESAPLNPLGIISVSATIYNSAFVLLFGISVMTGIASLVYRWRHTGYEVRQQIKLVIYAFLIMLAVLSANWVNTILVEAVGIELGLDSLLDTAMNLSLLGVTVALGLAVLKYRLYHIDFIINRTLVYGTLLASIITVYVLFVAGMGALLPLKDNLFLSLLATGIIAVLFNPLRIWLQRAANRLMFGRRDDPYAVLSELGRDLASAAVPGATLETVVEAVTKALRLPYAAIQLEQNGRHETRAEYGTSAATHLAEEIKIPLVHQNQIVGRLVVAPRAPGESLTGKDRQLLEDIAHQAGAVAHALRLTAALQRSREMLILAREEERRRIRRDLHDGLGPALASQTFRLDAALDLLPEEAQAVAAHLETLKVQNQRLVADIRRLVYELRPPALDQLGLPGALQAHADQVKVSNGPQIRIVTKPETLPALPAAVEVAAYRIALEAVTNVVRHAQARECTVMVDVGDAQLSLSVSDEGVGLPAPVEAGVGLTSMRERAEELGGHIEILRNEPQGTRVTAVLPIEGVHDHSAGQIERDPLPTATSIDGESHG